MPKWTGTGFKVGDDIVLFISYDVGESGWDDDIANVLATETDENRPIRNASLRRTIDQLSTWLPKADTPVILEIGCSTGSTISAVVDRFPSAFVIGAEYAASPLEALAPKFANVPLLQLDLMRSPLPSASLDAIVILNVLEHIEDDSAATAQLYRMLKPGGIVVIEVPAMPNLYDVFDKQVGHFRRYDMRSLVQMLEFEGFEIVSRNHLGVLLFPLFWVMKKRGQSQLKRPKAEQREAALASLRAGKKNRLLDLVFAVERKISKIVYSPFGIRCLVTCRRPEVNKNTFNRA